MSRRDFFQLFCMFYLQCINRKCAKEKKHQHLMLYQNWNRTPVYFKLAVSASYGNLFVPFPGIKSRLASFDWLLVQDVNKLSQLWWKGWNYVATFFYVTSQVFLQFFLIRMTMKLPKKWTIFQSAMSTKVVSRDPKM